MSPRPRPEIVGLIGTVLVVLVIVSALRFDSLPFFRSGQIYSASFAEVGGLRGGDDVMVSGARVGRVEEIGLDGAQVTVTFTVDDALQLGGETSARIVTVTLLGQAALEVSPAGSGDLGADRHIPLDRTTAPYNVSATLGDLTAESKAIDVDRVAEAMQQIASTFADTPPRLATAVRGIARLSHTIGANDEVLRQLLGRSARVTEVLASRNTEIAQLLISGEDLLNDLVQRRDVVVGLLTQVHRLSQALRPLIRANEGPLARTLKAMAHVFGRLNRNRVSLQAAIDGLRDYSLGFGESVSTGPFFDAYVQNLTAPASLAPILSGVEQ